PRGGDLDEVRSHFENALAHPRLAPLPPDPAKPIDLNLRLLRSVAGQEFEIFNRQKKLGAFSVKQFEAIMRRSRCFNRLKTRESPDTMINMDHKIAGRERGCFGQKMLGPACLAAPGKQP